MDEADIYSSLTSIFRKIFGDDEMTLNPSLTARDVLGWDSMKMVLIILETEERFGFRMRSSEVDQLECVGDLVSLVKFKVSQ